MKKAVIIIIVLLLLLSFLASIIAMAQQGAVVVTSEPASLKATEEILKVVASLRELPVKQPVKSGAKTREQIKESVIKDLSESNTPEEVEASSKTLKRLGLLPKDFKLRDYMISLLAEQVAGYYDPKSQFFYLASWIPLAEQKTVIAHELVHALQDQHFNLRRFEKWKKGDSDAETAAHALAEGEATIVMYQYEFAERGLKFDITKLPALTEMLLAEGTDNDSGKFPVLAKAPNALKESLQFPYFYGAGFVQAMLKKGSWKTLDEAYAQLPASTEQIIHPEKFLAKEAPVKIELADLSATLGRDWKQIDSDSNGEFGYHLILVEYTAKADARAAAAGWGGDRYATYADKKKEDRQCDGRPVHHLGHGRRCREFLRHLCRPHGKALQRQTAGRAGRTAAGLSNRGGVCRHSAPRQRCGDHRGRRDERAARKTAAPALEKQKAVIGSRSSVVGWAKELCFRIS
jgi:hypothetical protein